MPWEDPDEQKPGEPEKPLAVPELWSHVPNLESFLQELYTRSTGLSAEPTSAQFSALSARVQANSAAGASVDLTSVYNAISIVSVAANRDPIKLSAGNTSTPGYTFSTDPKTGMFLTSVGRLGFTISGVDTLDLLPNQFVIFGDVLVQDNTWDIGLAGTGRPRQIYAATRIKNANGTMSLPSYTFENDISTGMGLIAPNILGFATEGIERLRLTSAGATFAGTISSPTIDALSTAISVVSNAVSALSQSVSSQAAALSVRIDTQSQSISVLSNQVSILSNLHSALSQAVSVISQQVSVLSQSLSTQAAALSVRIDTQSQGISILSNQVSILSQAVSALSNQVSVLSNAVSSMSQAVSVLSNAVSAHSLAISVLKAARPGGRLTLSSLTAVLTSSHADAVKVYYTPYLNDILPIFDGTAWQVSSTAELNMSLDTSVHTAATNYDVFAVNDSGTRRIGTGPAWASDTARALSITRQDGIYVNASVISALRYGSLAVSAVASAQATYLGTFRTTSAGQTELSFGSVAVSAVEAKLYLWNMYNRVITPALVREGADSWTYATAAWRSANGSNNARVSFVRGLNEEPVWVHYIVRANAPAGDYGAIGIGLDVTNAIWNIGARLIGNPSNLAFNVSENGWPGLGYHFLQAVEYASTTTNITFVGDGGTPLIEQCGLLAHMRM